MLRLLEQVAGVGCQYQAEHSSVVVSRTWMKAVATMTPEPKYLAMKKAHSGTPMPLCLPAYTGKTAPIADPTMMTKMEEMRRPIRPSNSLPLAQVDAMTAGLLYAQSLEYRNGQS